MIGMRDLQINSVRVLDRTVDVLESFTADHPAMTIDEITRETKLPKATVYRILYTLERRGLIRYDPDTLQYTLGLRLLQYAGILSATLDVSHEAEDILIDLQASVSQTVLMAVMEGEEMVYVFRRENSEGLKYSSIFGQRRRLPFGVVGQVMMAYLSDDQIERVLSQPLQRWTEKTVVDPEVIRTRLKQIREDGWFIDVDETTMGVSGIGAPVFNADGNLAAAVGIIGPTVQFCGEVLEEAKRKLLDATRRISNRLGYYGVSTSAYSR
jgi:IclR family KDG regulon transcriptional repressor